MPHRLRHSGAEALHREMSCLFQSSLPRNVFPLVCPLPCCRCEQQLNPKSVAPGVRTCSHAPSLLEGSLLRTRSSNTSRCSRRCCSVFIRKILRSNFLRGDASTPFYNRLDNLSNCTIDSHRDFRAAMLRLARTGLACVWRNHGRVVLLSLIHI